MKKKKIKKKPAAAFMYTYYIQVGSELKKQENLGMPML